MPSLTIVLASVGPAHDVASVGAQLARQAARTGAEMIVAVPEGMSSSLNALRDIPNLRVITAPAGSDRGALCAMALQVATGDVVAFRDEAQLREAEWLEEHEAASLVDVEIARSAARFADRPASWRSAPTSPSPRVLPSVGRA